MLDALAAVQAIIRQRSIQGPLVGQLAGLSLDVSAGLGGSAADAAKRRTSSSADAASSTS
ncbi:MAG TPA: hypothetical protein VFS55_01590 [Dokdonella sp.]|nr:hypothetical protein [Dokdonella sp.]